ncbi:MAG: proline dehydrogenase [Pedobacter sp.]|nr:MAG: proline dehydrogenase [Pedobacter sp.]
MEELLKPASSSLKNLATNDQAKHYLLNNPVLYNIVRRAAERYIGGETLDETITKVIEANKASLKCSIEYMGENISKTEDAIAAKDEFLRISSSIATMGLNSTISLDLSHIGLNISRELCLSHLLEICQLSAQSGIEVNLSAEGPHQTDKVLSIYREASSLTPNLAVTLQAYLYRTREDFDGIKNLPGRIRIVKGAFGTDPGVSMDRGDQLNMVYLQYIAELLESRHKCSIATHHHEIQQEAKNLVDFYNPLPSDYEFESLYGIQQENLLRLQSEGYMTKLYLVYGKEWFLYLCNRLSEYPLNLFRALSDICG